MRFSPYVRRSDRGTTPFPMSYDVTSLRCGDPLGFGGRTDLGRNRRWLTPVFSTTSFLVPPPDCVPDTGNEHARSITFKIKKSGAASGVVSSTEDPAFTDCAAAVPVKIQRKTSGGWKTVGKATTTDAGRTLRRSRTSRASKSSVPLPRRLALGILLPTSV